MCLSWSNLEYPSWDNPWQHAVQSTADLLKLAIAGDRDRHTVQVEKAPRRLPVSWRKQVIARCWHWKIRVSFWNNHSKGFTKRAFSIWVDFVVMAHKIKHHHLPQQFKKTINLKTLTEVSFSRWARGPLHMGSTPWDRISLEPPIVCSLPVRNLPLGRAKAFARKPTHPILKGKNSHWVFPVYIGTSLRSTRHLGGTES